MAGLMGLRLAVLLGVGAIACFSAVVSSAHGSRSAVVSARIPALPRENVPTTGLCPIPRRFRTAFTHAARDTGLQLSMLVAVAQVESRFRANARSAADARGLLQVMPTTASELQLDPDRPSSNVLAGARYLRLMLNRFGRTDLALAAYNAGPTVVGKLGRAPSAETQTYVANVQQRWAALAGCS
jgi:soluble lytic murein transglycosylase-like protein